MIETEKILPCPHCGGLAKIMRTKSDKNVKYIYVRCIVCGASGKTARIGGLNQDEGSATLEAILAWNLRTAQTSQAADQAGKCKSDAETNIIQEEQR